MLATSLMSFAPRTAERVIKILRRHPRDPTGMAMRYLLDSEKRAYSIVAQHPTLRTHVAECYGVSVVEDVVDLEGGIVAERYHLDCCLELAYLSGTPLKLDELPPNQRPAVERLFDMFYEAGIMGIGDASVILPEGPGLLKIIDISTVDIANAFPSLFGPTS